MNTPAQVTEAHRAITESVCELLDSEEMVGPSPAERAAQLIADREAAAVAEIAMVAAASADRNVSPRLERDQLRAELERLKESLHLADGTANLALAHRDAAEAELANIRALANRRNKSDHSQDTTHQLVAALDQALDIAQAELAATKSTLDEEVNCAEKAEHEVVRQYARAERAEAELAVANASIVSSLLYNTLKERLFEAEDELLAVKMELDQVACARTDGILRESDLQCALNMEREKVKRLTTALEDAISTYDPDRKETLVTAERQEAWIAALKGGDK